MDPKLEKLAQKFEDVVAILNRDTVTEDDFMAAFSQVMDSIKSTNNATAEVLLAVFQQLEDFAQQLKSDTDQDRTQIKQIVGEALAELRTELDARMADVKSGTNGLPGKDADEAAMIAAVLAKIPPAPLPVPPIEETPDETIDKVNASTKQIDKTRVQGLADIERMAQANAGAVAPTTMFVNGYRAKNLHFNNAVYAGGDLVDIAIPVQPVAPSNPVLNQLWIDNS